ncbi:hypothetical protein [Leptothermofonsia sp. ETS-13]|uniref:hypothetical protein n=1 Tax=Leptothermofonsia sp. ETS-13 TaxID=3035696 RepID=UPI003B9F50C7
MSYRLICTQSFCGLVFLTLSVGFAIAHEVEVAGDIAGTWHIEPNHNPKAGVPTRTWIALTRRGGRLLPLNQAICQMAVYTKPRKPGVAPILRPSLKTISAERYQDIPGADIIFPKVGLYQLELNCTPKSRGDFRPFQMKYDVTVTK